MDVLVSLDTYRYGCHCVSRYLPNLMFQSSEFCVAGVQTRTMARCQIGADQPDPGKRTIQHPGCLGDGAAWQQCLARGPPHSTLAGGRGRRLYSHGGNCILLFSQVCRVYARDFFVFVPVLYLHPSIYPLFLLSLSNKMDTRINIFIF